MEEHLTISRVAFIGNYVPRQCGIATFTTDLCEAIAAGYADTSCIALPVNDIEGGYSYPPRVRFELTEQNIDSSAGVGRSCRPVRSIGRHERTRRGVSAGDIWRAAGEDRYYPSRNSRFAVCGPELSQRPFRCGGQARFAQFRIAFVQQRDRKRHCRPA